MGKTIYAGIGTDLWKGTVTDNNGIFVDPDIDRDVFSERKIYSCSLHHYLIRAILQTPNELINGTISSLRMIEHIPLNKLVLEVIPLLKNLCKELGTMIVLGYPDMNRIHSILNNIDYRKDLGAQMFCHDMLNIETIAQGDHKVILTKEIIEQLFEDPELKIDHNNLDLDMKPFYTQTTISKDGEFKSDELVFDIEEPATFTVVNELVKGNNINGMFWNLSNKIDEKLGHLEAASEIWNRINQQYAFFYGSAEKFANNPELYNRMKVPNVCTEEYLSNYLFGEGHFTPLNDPRSVWVEKLFDKVHPFLNVCLFKKNSYIGVI